MNILKNFKNKSQKAYIIAEAGVNHNGSTKLAKKLIDKAKESGADCIKFQLFKSENLVQKSTPLAGYQKQNISKKITQNDMLKKLELNQKNLLVLFKYTKKKKIDFLCTPYSFDDLKFLNKINVNAIKLSSMHSSEYFFINEALKLNKPVLLPTGMCNQKDIIKIKTVLKKSRNKNVCIMQCTTNYPTSLSEANINVLLNYRKIFKNYIIGFSDHTKGSLAACASIVRGAKIIEKHFTLSNKLKGPDHIASLNPDDFKQFVKNIRETELVLGSQRKIKTENEKINEKIVKRSLVTVRNIKKGQKITIKNISFKRPLNGIPASQFDKFIGKTAKKNIKVNSLLSKTHIKLKK